jgi:hypothetical protein
MRRVALFAVLMLSIVTAAAWAKAPVPPVALDKAQFLDSLGAPQPVEAASRRSIQTKSTCTVTLTCDAGAYPLQCSSSSGNCSSGATWVSCNGVQQNCPVCHRFVTCCDDSTRECWGWSYCPLHPGAVECDGEVSSCPPLWECGP